MYTSEELIKFFPMFDRSLAEFISSVSEVRSFDEGTIMMKTGQYFKSSMLIIDGKVKLYREGKMEMNSLCISSRAVLPVH